MNIGFAYPGRCPGLTKVGPLGRLDALHQAVGRRSLRSLVNPTP